MAPQAGFIKRTRMFYGNYEFEPAPLFSWSTATVRASDNTALFKSHTLDFNGTLLPNAAASGQLDDVITLQNQLRTALGSGNQEFRITFDGTHVVSGVYPRVDNVVIGEGLWAQLAEYSFSFNYEEELDANFKVQSFSETWQFDEDDNRLTVAVNHNISAVGLDTNPSGVSNAFDNAKDFVINRTGYANAKANAPFFAQVSGLTFNAYAERRTEQHDVQGGSFQVSENFTLSSGNFVNTNVFRYNEDAEGIVTVAVEGQVRGLGRRDECFDHALNAFLNTVEPQLAVDASGFYNEFNGPAELFTNNKESFSITKNRFAGTIDYSVSYNDSPAENLPDGIQEFNLSVSRNEPVELNAVFNIPERAGGPIRQLLQTSTVGTYTVTGSCTGKPSTDMAIVINYVQSQLNANKGPGIITSNNITKDTRNKTVNFSVTWEFLAPLNQAARTTPIVQ